MKIKKKIIIYPNPRNKIKINTHHGVCGFFLNKYLLKYYDIIPTEALRWISKSGGVGPGTKQSNLLNFAQKAHELGASHVISTQQRGFTKIFKKLSSSDIGKIRKRNKGVSFCSVHDHSGHRKFAEDVLFVALPFDEKRRRQMLKESETKLIHTGWCADHAIFNDNKNKHGDLNIVLDHAALQGFRADATSLYVKQIKKLKKNYPKKEINLCRIKGGFEFFDFKRDGWTHDLKNRWWKSKYDDGWKNDSRCHIFQIAECLNDSHIFCTTHVESCGLTGIEALMSGCKVYIPRGKDTFNMWGSGGKMGSYEGPFLKSALLKPYMDYSIFNFNNPQQCYKLFKRDIDIYKVKYNRKLLIEKNSWKAAAKQIYLGLESK
jgi:hypothetical protein